MLQGRFGLQNKDLGTSLGAIAMVFRDLHLATAASVWGFGPRCAPFETQGEGLGWSGDYGGFVAEIRRATAQGVSDHQHELVKVKIQQ